MRIFDERRSYADHLIAEHRRLHRMLRVVSTAIMPAPTGGPAPTSAAIIKVLREVRDELERHFAQEEGGGCLDEAVSCCPTLSPEARRIEAEHPRLLESMDRLIAQAQDYDQSVEKRIELEREFEELCRQLAAHEAAENTLLRRGLGGDINGDDYNSTRHVPPPARPEGSKHS
jgi:hypothetical protein